MKSSREFSRHLALVTGVLVIAVGGCASFRDGERKPISSWPLHAAEQKQSINLFVNGKIWINDKREPVQPDLLGAWRTVANEAFKESGLFSDVKLSSEDSTDLRADIDIEQKGEFSEVLAFVTGFTLGLSSIVIPQKSSDTVIIMTTFKDREGHVLASTRQSETVNTWIQLFLVFVMPFRDGQDVTMTAVYSDLHRAALVEVHQKNLLIPVKAARTDLNMTQ